MENQHNLMETLVPSETKNVLTITDKGKKDLKSMSCWVKFYAILGCVGIACLFFSGVFMLITRNFLPFNETIPEWSSATMVLMGIIYIILAIIMIFPVLFLFRSAGCSNKALALNSDEYLEASIHNMKTFWKFTGIVNIVFLGLAVLMVFAVMVLAITLV
ncbi:MAG: DUF5362 family protein [Bacteroidales bacterium]